MQDAENSLNSVAVGAVDGYSITTASIYPQTLTIIVGGIPVVKISQGGVVEVNPQYEADEAARKFWEAVRNVAPGFFKAATAAGAA